MDPGDDPLDFGSGVTGGEVYRVGGCPFCDIVAGEAPATIVRNFGPAIAIEPLNPVTPGHVIVLPIDHVPDALADPLITATAASSSASLAEGPCNLITSVGTEATQTVMHLHWHIVPRRVGDGLALPWSPSA